MLGLEFSHITSPCRGILFFPHVAGQNTPGISSESLFEKRHLKIIYPTHSSTNTEACLCAVIQNTFKSVVKFSVLMILIGNIRYALLKPVICCEWPVQLAAHTILKKTLLH